MSRSKDWLFLIDSRSLLVALHLPTYLHKLFDTGVTDSDHVEVDSHISDFCVDRLTGHLVYIKPSGQVSLRRLRAGKLDQKSASIAKLDSDEDTYYHCLASYDQTIVVGCMKGASSLALVSRRGKVLDTVESFSKGVIKYVELVAYDRSLLAVSFMAFDYYSMHGIARDKLLPIALQVKVFDSEHESVYSYQVMQSKSHVDVIVSGYPYYIKTIRISK